MKHIEHRGKEKTKFGFDITLHSAGNLKGLVGAQVFLSWRRGSKKKSGTTRMAPVRADETATIDEKIHIDCTFFKEGTEFDDKPMSITLKEAVPKKSSGRSLGKLRINLSRCTNKEMKELKFTFENHPKLSTAPILVMSLSSAPVKLGNHKLSKAEEGEESGGKGMITVIDGAMYHLDDKSEHSDPSVDSPSVVSELDFDATADENSVFTRTDPDPADQTSSSAAKSLHEEIEMTRTENYERLKKIQEQETELQELRRKLATADEAVQKMSEENLGLSRTLEEVNKDLRKFTNLPVTVAQPVVAPRKRKDKAASKNKVAMANLSNVPSERAAQLAAIVEALELVQLPKFASSAMMPFYLKQPQYVESKLCLSDLT
eukprot:TRINITY_DN699_c0_g1_i4.p1 TRINITY_DN699_c0_g1~~TRINITY_DN699_c0_g1_i4.p1  ORF type:complete len:414 (+),score=95.68 TRINITY_DN699_c0_g1_i4:118-1242(+)